MHLMSTMVGTAVSSEKTAGMYVKVIIEYRMISTILYEELLSIMNPITNDPNIPHMKVNEF